MPNAFNVSFYNFFLIFLRLPEEFKYTLRRQKRLKSISKRALWGCIHKYSRNIIFMCKQASSTHKKQFGGCAKEYHKNFVIDCGWHGIKAKVAPFEPRKLPQLEFVRHPLTLRGLKLLIFKHRIKKVLIDGFQNS